MQMNNIESQDADIMNQEVDFFAASN